MSKQLTKVYYKLDTKEDQCNMKNLGFEKFYGWLQKNDFDETLKSLETRIIQGYEDIVATRNSFSMCISFYDHNDANSFRRYMSYREFEGNARAVAFWYGICPAHEVIVRNVPLDSTRRTIFEKFENYGNIGRVTPCKTNPSVYWVAFISSKGAKTAIAKETNISSAKGNKFEIPSLASER
ncbi:hypothetical protein TVAG_333950 [Trichomonas vaginalis G3]|uniref:RRM domain-containing protein n=1 Tax=Trichomonas vaginalis (strain ATCC PRA-98 / G3) TaxID=412133 RepID=A2EIA1_TRIV3|nr:RNA-binding domain, RBD family-containing protein [Trichomonas vaginalis G3]EAY07583.1 hypothetical protein TVAG_333950 [Trichomonas vaginalis G3]KAI5541947.1 RNA-binding domain, RBD family-containing protein [Trichomonas vaginalis G3]|eukprot:XP_001319806.1 hypothetical protein [Trichomonas vaginalis G3]